MWWIVASILAVGDPNAPELAPPVQVQAGGQPINVDMGHAALLNAPFVAKPAKKFGKINILSLSSAHWQGPDPRRPSRCPGPLAKDSRRHPPRDRSATRNRTKPWPMGSTRAARSWACMLTPAADTASSPLPGAKA